MSESPVQILTRDRFGGADAGFWPCPWCGSVAKRFAFATVVFGINPTVMAARDVIGVRCARCDLEQLDYVSAAECERVLKLVSEARSLAA